MAGAAAQPEVKEPSGFKLAITLGIAGLLSGLALVTVYEMTLPTITENQARALQRAVFKVVPESAEHEGATMIKLIEANGALTPAPEGSKEAGVYGVYTADGTLLGYAVPGEGPGFQDVIKLIYGFDPTDRVIIGMEVLESRETPGLGDRIYKDAEFAKNFEALAVEPKVVAVKHGEKTDPNQIDAITGATISSKAVAKIIQNTNEKWLSLLPDAEGAKALFQAQPAQPQAGGEAQ